MPTQMSRMRSELKDTPKETRLLAHIKKLFDQKAHHLTIQIGRRRVNAADCDAFAFDPTASGGTAAIVFTEKSGGDEETYDLADIQIIKRLRTKKYCIRLKDTANPA